MKFTRSEIIRAWDSLSPLGREDEVGSHFSEAPRVHLGGRLSPSDGSSPLLFFTFPGKKEPRVISSASWPLQKLQLIPPCNDLPQHILDVSRRDLKTDFSLLFNYTQVYFLLASALCRRRLISPSADAGPSPRGVTSPCDLLLPPCSLVISLVSAGRVFVASHQKRRRILINGAYVSPPSVQSIHPWAPRAPKEYAIALRRLPAVPMFRKRHKELSMVPNRPVVVSPPPPVPSGSAPLEKSFHDVVPKTQCGYWKVCSAKSNFGDKEASVFVFEKKSNVKAPPRIGRMNKFSLQDLIKYEVTQLTSLAHPKILHTLHPLEELKDMISFATEAINCSLDTLVVEQGIETLEMKLGVLQVIDGLSYLHNSAKILHGNLTPSSVYVTMGRQWKIAGFTFSVTSKEPNLYPCFPWTKKLPPMLQPELDFLAPEYLHPNQTHVTSAADVFSLGLLICWIYAGGKRLIDAKNNLETHAIIIDQLTDALNCIAEELGSNLRECLGKVLSLDEKVRPTVGLLAMIKHFDDPALSALRQLDDISQVFDPSQKAHFLSHQLYQALPNIPEALWFSRLLPRLNEQLWDSPELFPAVAKPLFYLLEHCESHNIHKLRSWMRKIIESSSTKPLRSLLLENMSVLFRRLSDERVEDKLLDLLISSIKSEDASMQSQAVRGLVNVAEMVPLTFISKRLLPALQSLPPYLHDNVPRQLDLLIALTALSDRCDYPTLATLIQTSSLCSSHHHAVVHAKSRLVQRIVTRDPVRLRDPTQLCIHLLNPLCVGLSYKELTAAHFDDVMSSVRILLDIVEQLRYEEDDRFMHHEMGRGRLGSRRVSMSSNNLPRVMISAARPSFSSDSRKMSFLSADGRLEDRGRRESRDSRGSLESDMSIRIGGSDISDDSAHSGTSARGRRQSWLENYAHSMSLEQQHSFLEAKELEKNSSIRRSGRCSERRSRTRSPNGEEQRAPARPNSFTNLGHNLVLTYRTLWNNRDNGASSAKSEQ